MTKVSKILGTIEKYAPSHLCFDGDNVGLLVGSLKQEVSRILLTLDVDEYVVKEAIEKNANLIISHHPVMFRPISTLTDDCPQQRCIRLMIENSISLISAHTNLDSVNGGLNDYLCKKLSITNTEVIDVTGEYEGCLSGFGRVGEFEKEITLKDTLSLCSERLNCKGLRYVGNTDTVIKRVAVNSGSGADVIPYCIKHKVDALITGDVKYNQARDAYESGLCIIDAGHYETERIVTELFEEILKKEFGDITIGISNANTPVFKYYNK